MTVASGGRLAAIVAVGMMCRLSLAHAQSAEAEVLFREGRDLIKRGKTAVGCDKLAASERLESSVGTLLNLGDCREKLGKLASAWAAFRKAEAMARRTGGDDKRQAEAARRAAQLEPRLPNLVIEVPARVDGLVVRRGSEVVDDASWGSALPVDPGSYEVIAEAPGYVPWHMTVQVSAGGKRQVVSVPRLERAPVAPPPEPIAPAPASPFAEPAPTTVIVPPRPAVRYEPAGTWSATRKLAVVVALAGAGAVGTGVYFGWRSKDLQGRADQRCPTTVCNDLEGLRLNDRARTAALGANIFYVTGGAALATSLVMWLAGGPDATIVAPTASDRSFGVSMTGSF